MGIHINTAVLLRDWIHRHSIAGPALTLGVQSVPYTGDELSRALGILSLRGANVDARALFDALGLGVPTALDINAREGADILFDLNDTDVPLEQRHRYGLVFNGGTLEHVFHVPNALANMTAMLRPGGSIAHVLPLHNWVDHGFYQFSPTLMFDYYAAAGFEVLESTVASFEPRRQAGATWEITAAAPGLFGGAPGALDDRTYFHFVLVRATDRVCERPIPIQSAYANKPLGLSRPPRWFSPFELQFGTRVDHPNRSITPLRTFEREAGRGWVCSVPELEAWSDSVDDPSRSPLIVLQDDRPLCPSHASHQVIREVGGGAYSHWGRSLYLSTPDGSDPNDNGYDYVAILPGRAS